MRSISLRSTLGLFWLLCVSCRPPPITRVAPVATAPAPSNTQADSLDDLDITIQNLSDESEAASLTDSKRLEDNGKWTEAGDSTSDSTACGDLGSACNATLDDASPEAPGTDSADGDLASNGGYNVATGNAPIPKILPWPPQCASPKSKSLNLGSNEPSCWDPPNGSCASSDLASVTPACSSEGEYCCVFSNTCIPCGWVDCFGCPNADDCPSVCMAQKWPYLADENQSIWYSKDCLLLQNILNNCATCGSDTYCPWVD